MRSRIDSPPTLRSASRRRTNRCGGCDEGDRSARETWVAPDPETAAELRHEGPVLLPDEAMILEPLTLTRARFRNSGSRAIWEALHHLGDRGVTGFCEGPCLKTAGAVARQATRPVATSVTSSVNVPGGEPCPAPMSVPRPSAGLDR